MLSAKPNLRVLEDRERRFRRGIDPETRDLGGGMLMQDAHSDPDDRSQFEVATERHPSEEEWAELLFAWRVVRHVKSNAIVITKDRSTIGIGAGQMSRVDSVRIALDKSRVDSSTAPSWPPTRSSRLRMARSSRSIRACARSSRGGQPGGASATMR